MTLPLYLNGGLNLSLRLKIKLSFAFILRIPLIILSTIYLLQIRNLADSDEPQLDAITSLILQQLMITSSLISATIPNIATFVKSFSMALGAAVFRPNRPDHPQSFPLQSLRASTQRSKMDPSRNDNQQRSESRDRLWSDQSFRTTIFAGRSRDGDEPLPTENRGILPAITREVRWVIEYESV